ncbi:MAG: hypothetical protein V4710_14235 [Verrucomicrobiota bacterium]
MQIGPVNGGISSEDLAPGDTRAASLDLSRFQIDRINSVDDPLFDFAYARLWREFGAQGEMESRETLRQRFRLAPAMLYEMVLLRHEEAFAAVRDQTAIPTANGMVVHLSHNLVAPEWRRTGLAGWMRAFPLSTARRCASMNGMPPDFPLTLVAEMEHATEGAPERGIRLCAYEKAGFLKVDPSAFSYHQPDFRAPDQIDASGGARPLALQLLIRRIGQENDALVISGAALGEIVGALYRMYGAQFRAHDMAHPALDLSRCPSPETRVRLVAPRF